MWIAVIPRFRSFDADLLITDAQRDDGFGKAKRISQCLKSAYYGDEEDPLPYAVVGSWGKQTQVRPSNDIDVMFVLPWDVYYRINQRLDNKQSALLQEIKGVLAHEYTQTDLRGDGQVVVIAFNSLTVDLVPVFGYSDGTFLMPDTRDGGVWKTVDPFAQINLIEASDQQSNSNVRPLTRMIKMWARVQNVPMRSFWIELLVVEFMSTYVYRSCSFYYYDWFIRDFFNFLKARPNTYLSIPGTGELVAIGAAWLSKANSAHSAALTACDYERADQVTEAGVEWQKIFGPRILATPS